MNARFIADLVANKHLYIERKKASDKFADAYGGNVSYLLDDDRTEIKKADELPKTVSKIKVRSVINTTKLFDSHGDVHIDQLWNKSLRDRKNIYLLNEHVKSFSHVISRNVHAFVKQMSWAELGYTYEGSTQALVFDSVIDRDTIGSGAKDMFEDYRKGYVDQHSVGMRYVDVALAVNDDRYKEEKQVWEKYIQEVANKEDVMEAGYFYAVTQAKVIEGSAVLMGANYATPTLHVEDKSEPVMATRSEPVTTTPKASDILKFYNL